MDDIFYIFITLLKKWSFRLTISLVNVIKSAVFWGIYAFYITAQKMKFSINDFFSKCEQIRSFLRIWSHLRKKSLKENLVLYVFHRTHIFHHKPRFSLWKYF